MLAVQITLVLPISMRTDPSACGMKLGVILTGRSWLGVRPSALMKLSEFLDKTIGNWKFSDHKTLL